jgi:zinc-ribbon domain
MPVCTRCGSRSEEDARFCGKCGARVSAVAIPNMPRAKKAGRNPAKILGAIFLCFVLFVIFMPKASTPNSTKPTPNDTTAKLEQPKSIEVKADKYGAVFCPTLSDYDGYRTSFAIWWNARDSNWEDEIDGEIKMDAEENGCSVVPSGTPMTLQSKFQEAGDPDPNDAVASVTMRASDGTTMRGFTEADSLDEQ